MDLINNKDGSHPQQGSRMDLINNKDGSHPQQGWTSSTTRIDLIHNKDGSHPQKRQNLLLMKADLHAEM